ncbi:YtxH domain-containing protein [Nocardioides sp. JQ2195]|uniref:YtxH domain-containing protein n=1 Tax=Nocardioides sp. JQ2195 TaxID=2592334 RepID=UPI00198264D7|nr:YtxH domain-containing protein [Nocardioides sp. JQ2195]
MNGKLKMIIGLGAGYVLGARAGRERYEQIVRRAKDFGQNPKVRAKAEQARDLAGEKAGHAAEAARSKASETVSAAKHKVHGSGEPTTGLDAGLAGSDPETTADLGALGTGPATPGEVPR